MLGAILKIKAAGRNVKSRSGHESESSQVSKEYSLRQIFKTGAAVALGQETYCLTGDFERDFCELCSRNDVPAIKIAPRPHRPSSPVAQHPDTSMSKGKESKEDRNRGHQAHQPPPEPPKPADDKDQELPPTTFTTKDKYEYFQPRIEIENEDEGNKTHLKEFFIRGWKVDAKVLEVLSMTLPKQDRLVSINLWNAGLSDDTLELLAKIVVQCHSLKDLCLDGNAYIRQHHYDLFLKEECSVQNLSLKNCYVNDIGAENIATALADNKNLTTLNLCFNKITCTGAEHLAKGLRMNRSLLSLNLGSNLIGERGAAKLAESLSRFALTHKEVVQRRMLLSKKSADEPSSPTRGIGPVSSSQRPPSVKSGSHLKDDKKSQGNKGAAKKKDTLQKSQKDSSSKKASSIDIPMKGSTKSQKKTDKTKPDKKGQTQSDHESPELFEFPHPLLETADEIKGELWVPGNRALINLNLARNKIPIDGVREFYQAIQYQISLASQTSKTIGIGLLRLSLQRNPFDPSDPTFIQLNEIMATRDPFYKPPPPQSPTKELGKDDN
ncbi:leucine-rich repeat-containing protein 71-like isoform X1 [Rhopilema esculentum]|uniref:leucine-rich repeat-containing protein 71-like isoform X1 n=2 Tax=Rhopilema esculentum TaxID=499914 RepID=UPI0031D471D0